jgi:hypothetical protein
MNIKKLFLSETLATIAFHLEARTFEIVFNVTANQREVSILTTAVNNQLRPTSHIDNTFIGSQFQLSLRLDDQGYSGWNNVPINPVNTIYQFANAKIASLSPTPFSTEINSIIPNGQYLQNNLSDPNGLNDFGLPARSMTINEFHQSGITQTSYSIFSGEYQSVYFGPERIIGNESIIADREIFQRELSLNYFGNGWQGMQPNNYPVIDLSTPQGLLSVLNLLKDNQGAFEFTQRVLETHTYGVDPDHYYPCDSIDCVIAEAGAI